MLSATFRTADRRPGHKARQRQRRRRRQEARERQHKNNSNTLAGDGGKSTQRHNRGRGIGSGKEAYGRVDPALAARLGGLDASEEVDGYHVLGTRDLPRVAEAQPVVRLLELPAVLDALLEDAVVVAQAVAVRREADRGHRVEEARRQTPETAVAQTRVLLDLLELLEL